MQNTHSREDAFDCPPLVTKEVVCSGPCCDDRRDPEARTEAQDIALRDALLRRYPLKARVVFIALPEDRGGGDWQVVKHTTAEKTERYFIADALAEEYARVLADALNAREAAV